MSQATQQKKTKMIEAMCNCLGVVSDACKIVGISRKTYYDWMKDDDDFRQSINDIDEIALDYAETQLFKQIREGSTTATIFFLKTKGRKRGYIERQEFAIDNTRPDLSQLSIDEIKQLLDEPSKE